MIDADLLDELDAAAAGIGGMNRLSAAAAAVCVQQLCEKFVADSAHRWWWESLAVPSKRLNYGNGDGLAVLTDVVSRERGVVLVVTDDVGPPWVVYEGEAKAIVSALRECRFFEYILAAQDASWIIFDTHMNELVIAGRLAA
jgi:hypothetical protein